MDSGTKNKRLLRLLSVLLLAVLLVSVSSLAVLADGEEGPPTAAESDAAGGYVSAFPSGYPNVPQNATYGERLMYGLQVAGIGLLVVFLVLVIIMAILYIFKLVALSKTKTTPKAAPEVSKAVTAAPKAAPVSAASGSEEETIVAIATAAIAASRGASECAFKVISVTKIQ